MDIEEAIERLKYINMAYDCNNYYSRYDLDCIETALNLIQTQQAELEKKEAIINEMSNFINLMGNELVAETGDNNLEFCKRQKCIDNEELDCEECIKEYFTNKVEREGK